MAAAFVMWSASTCQVSFRIVRLFFVRGLNLLRAVILSPNGTRNASRKNIIAMNHISTLQQVFNAISLRQRDCAEVITLPDVDTKEERSVAFVRERKLLANRSDDLIPHRVARDSREQIIYPNTHQNEAFGVDTIEDTGVRWQLCETIVEPKLTKVLVEETTNLLYPRDTLD
ncbi:MAG: hypothetical protein WCG92_26870 [Hyphomicrobiales bacterium]